MSMRNMSLKKWNKKYGPDDWVCPKIGCKNINFARRTECQRCKTSKFYDNSRIPSSESPGISNVPTIPLHIDDEETIELEDDVQNNTMNLKPIPSNSIQINFLQKHKKQNKPLKFKVDLEAKKRQEEEDEQRLLNLLEDEDDDEEFVIEKVLGKKHTFKSKISSC